MLALEGEHSLPGGLLSQHYIADLKLSTGRLVAVDPLAFCRIEPFELQMPKGVFPVHLTLFKTEIDERVAFATIRFTTSKPQTWRMLTLPGQDAASLPEGNFFGYGVDSGTGSFMDESTALDLLHSMDQNAEYFQVVLAELERSYRDHKLGLDMPFKSGNLIAFTSGYGDGTYGSYAGFDATGNLTAVVTDFIVLPADPDQSPSERVVDGSLLTRQSTRIWHKFLKMCGCFRK